MLSAYALIIGQRQGHSGNARLIVTELPVVVDIVVDPARQAPGLDLPATFDRVVAAVPHDGIVAICRIGGEERAHQQAIKARIVARVRSLEERIEAVVVRGVRIALQIERPYFQRVNTIGGNENVQQPRIRCSLAVVVEGHDFAQGIAER